ncbi:alpha/beta hydrolase [Gordonia zhenghanii]|nr:alpha/beta hydrolase [Gordonia zhenghanii]
MERTDRGGSPRDGAILYLHGGAFLVGGIRSHRRLVSRIVRTTGVSAFAVAYRQLPHHSMSTSISDCLEALQRIIDSGVSVDKIAIVGDSAGGYLALMVARAAERGGTGRVACIGCMSPIIDLDPTGKLRAPESNCDPLIPPTALTTMWREISVAEPDVEYLRSLREIATASSTELAQLPPLLIQVGSDEILRPDSDALVALSAAARGDVALELYPGQVHVFQAGADLIPEARVALNRMADHIVRHLVADERRRSA